jgi:hypothetical protein
LSGRLTPTVSDFFGRVIHFIGGCFSGIIQPLLLCNGFALHLANCFLGLIPNLIKRTYDLTARTLRSISSGEQALIDCLSRLVGNRCQLLRTRSGSLFGGFNSVLRSGGCVLAGSHGTLLRLVDRRLHLMRRDDRPLHQRIGGLAEFARPISGCANACLLGNVIDERDIFRRLLGAIGAEYFQSRRRNDDIHWPVIDAISRHKLRLLGGMDFHRHVVLRDRLGHGRLAKDVLL